MTQTTARIKKGGLRFEVLVDLDEALSFKKGLSDSLVIGGDRIFSDVERGDVVSKNDLEVAFGTNNINEIGKTIVKQGEVLVDQEYRNEEREKKIKQIVDFLSKNAIDPQSGNPISPERIKSALEQANISVKNTPIDSQVKGILEKISSVIPIKIETKKIKITIPAIYTGQVYGLVSQYKEKENWMNDGSLEIFVNIPAGITFEFYDKLNSITHGSALTEEIKE